ncbi:MULTISPECIES: hypothetical protein [unclassified Bradyrhizobium]|uniref:hypothetical protein n=1 Tax=unclassified Bradyrhizobium TaxID=2631580 RepID=UPI001BAD76C6|nr:MULTISPECIES: hypothetical protein [unclassified Bradyrhizobium]MBR1201247.1 hypothetical protein [Bradyrhizobium sp. AUGA SZCCT0124]MBR1316827.1 hypothetical protein [Bradyrhizobium sp. AUGA SZCCT0051]MBR1345114.1 hypothetical protein [Bradyrhizobium sp. AUGA SZCCT0105]MBR1359837.1 hypothetical protein [Bradyrhizobium sp. AUGA SZCCT0045]
MAEFVIRAIGALIEAVLDALVAHTGRRVLALCGLQSNLFVEFLIGFVVWAIFGLALTVLITVLFVKP